MQAWPLDTPPASSPQRALAGVIAGMGQASFAQTALDNLNGLFEIGSWSVYRLWADRPPELQLSASQGPQDITRDCFRTYCDDGLYRNDGSFAPVRAAGRTLMLRTHADEIPSATHREAIYRRHGMLERLSVARAESDGSLIALNLYRHTHQGRYSAGEVEQFAQMATPLLAAAVRHADLATPPVFHKPDIRWRMQQQCPALTARELDVLERLLQGLSYDGIAADMGLSVGTVKTYRARAFARLDMHFKSELFARFLRAN
jgi:DNA-binding CsgD family transcriptional regulator